MKKSEFDLFWREFLENRGGDLGKLSDEEVTKFARYYMSSGISQADSQERLWIFMTEMNQRNAAKIANLGLILAGVAIIVGVVQIAVSLCGHN